MSLPSSSGWDGGCGAFLCLLPVLTVSAALSEKNARAEVLHQTRALTIHQNGASAEEP